MRETRETLRQRVRELEDEQDEWITYAGELEAEIAHLAAENEALREELEMRRRLDQYQQWHIRTLAAPPSEPG